jgi:fermentation-respiration switch protein FrsA (DUF1100 family)
MLLLTKWLFLTLYALCPAVAVGRARWRKRRGLASGAARLNSTAGMAVALGLGLNFAYAFAAGASVRFGQILLTCYFLMSLILLLRALNWVLERGLARLLGATGRRVGLAMVTVLAFIAGVTRVAIMFGIGLPLIMASVMTYRCKVAERDDPQQQLGFKYEPVSFRSRDGIPLAGWWIPAVDRFGRPVIDASETVIVCHGLGANKSNQLALAAHFVPERMNVLIFDFRAHGSSGGQVSSFGDLERFDVLGAVRYVREHRTSQAKHIYGVGASMGAAALIAAAAENSDDGQAIEAVAVYGTYDSLASLARDIADSRFAPPLNWLTLHVAVPLASAHAGTDLTAFSPAALADKIAPRPMLFIHGRQDLVIPFARGEALRDAASQPKYHMWMEKGDHNGIINDPSLGKIVAEFFRTAPQAL